MPSNTVQRKMTTAERQSVEGMLRRAPTNVKRWKQGAENTLVLWAALMLALVVVWLALAWVTGKFFPVELGMRSPVAIWVVGAGAVAFLPFAVVSSVRWVEKSSDYRSLLRADLERGTVLEEHFVFSEAKRFQEPEHGGLIYFLRADDDRVLSLFDSESQDLGVGDEDPLKSNFKPQAEMTIVRIPNARFVLNTAFTGAVLDAGPPLELTVGPELWPEHQECTAIPWNELETRLAAKPPQRQRS